MRKLLTGFFLAGICFAQVTVNGTSTSQPIDGFGVSDAFQGGGMSTTDLDNLFSTSTGAGLSLLRTLIPSNCSDSPGDCSSVQASCAGNNVTDIVGAIARGAKVWSDTWTPPASMKSNNSCTNGGSLNAGSYPAYASWLTNYVKSMASAQSLGVASQNIPIYAISVQNEPDISRNYDTALWSGANIRDFIKTPTTGLGPLFSAAGLTTKIMVSEPSCGASGYSTYVDPVMNDATAAGYVGIVAAHDYCPPPDGTAYTNGGKPLWMTEISDVNNQQYIITGPTAPIVDALYWAVDVHSWMQVNATAWHYWTWHSGNINQTLIPSSNAAPLLRMWAIGNYSRFVRPGWVRVSATANPATGVYIDAFKDPATGNFAIVAINCAGAGTTGCAGSAGTSSQTFTLTNLPVSGNITVWRTSATENLTSPGTITPSAGSFSATLAASSVTTFVGSAPSGPQTYYVDYVSGSDSNAGTSKLAPWKHAKYMQAATGVPASTTLNPGDSVILKGGITWPAASGVWYIQSNGTAGHQIYYGVDQTWYDTAGCQQINGVTITGGTATSDPVMFSTTGGTGTGATGYVLRNASNQLTTAVMVTRGTGYTGGETLVFSGGGVSGASGTVTINSGWCRPILNSGGTQLNFNSVTDQIFLAANYVTLDNMEIIGMSNQPNPAGQVPTGINDQGGSGPTVGANNIISNNYVHAWVDSFFCLGTGNIAANSSTITGFVPTYGATGNTCPGLTTWKGTVAVGTAFLPVQVFPQNSYWPTQSSAPGVVAITNNCGANCYQITTNSTPVASACNSCLVMVGYDGFRAFSGDAGTNNGTFVTNNVVDGSDEPVVYQLNPYPDCGASEGNNNPCIASGHLADQGPGYFTNNVARFLGQNYFGGCSVIAGNLIEYLRIPIDPTNHGNGWECLNEGTPAGNLVYNNVFRHWSIQNPNQPGGRFGIGVTVTLRPNASQHDYAFNNVIDDTTTNYFWQMTAPTSGGSGTVDLFNNSGNCGLAWDLSGPCANAWTGTTKATNENYVTTNTNPFDAGVTQLDNKVWNPTQAASFTSSATYLYSPLSGSPTIGAGASTAALCTAVGALYAPAGTACQSDTTYGATYDLLHRTAATGFRASVSRPATPDVGAYQFTTACTLSPVTLGPFTAGQSVSVPFSSSNCPMSSWTLSNASGSGLSINSSTGLLTGTAIAGSFPSFTVTYSGTNDPIALTINATPSVTTLSMPTGSVGVAYSKQLVTSGGTGTVTCALTGTLPSGLSLSNSPTPCLISGTPSAANNFSFSITPTDSLGISGSATNLSITINSTCSLSPTSLSFQARATVSQQFTATGCNSSSYTISSGTLTGSGLTLSSGGLLSGTAVAGTYTFTISYDTATDPISFTILPSTVPSTKLSGKTTFKGSGSLK